MFNNIYSHSAPSDAELATQTLGEESSYRFPSFCAADAVTLGLSIRKRFRASSRHVTKGRGLVISIQTVGGHTLFACTVGDLGGANAGVGDVSLDSWASLEGMINVVRRTGHSSFYVEKGIAALGKSVQEIGIKSEYSVYGGGERGSLASMQMLNEICSFSHLACRECLVVASDRATVQSRTECAVLSHCHRRSVWWIQRRRSQSESVGPLSKSLV